uniref:Spermatogenesis associated 6 like n=1 Tax=Mus musculus TaxID=10090 RepID=H3BLJ4_MOUSE
MPMEVVVELQIRAISCPGVFLPDKEAVYLGVYLLNQYLETDCFPPVFPVVIQQSMRFVKHGKSWPTMKKTPEISCSLSPGWRPHTLACRGRCS